MRHPHRAHLYRRYLSAAARVASRLRGRQAGSAYLTTLLVLVVLSTVGVSVALVTQTEVLIGGADRMIHMVFYAADSGVAAATSKALVNADFEATVFEIEDKNGLATLGLREQVDLSPFLPTLTAPCNLCEINDADVYGDNSYNAIDYAIVVTATRVGGNDATPIAQGSVGAVVEVQPWRSPVEAYLPLDDPAALARFSPAL